MFHRILPLACCTLALPAVACGSPDDSSATDDGLMEQPMGPSTEPGTGDPDLPDAQSGTDGTMPCPPFESGFDGDDLCILPPEPGVGLHMHVGPTDYDDPEQIERFTVPPGAEPTQYYLFNTDNEEPVSFYRQHYRMRPGSHHLIVHLVSTPIEQEGWVNTMPDGIQIGGTQRSVSDFPPGGVIPEEDAHLARPVGVQTPMAFEMHYVNATEEPILREAWVNFMQTDAENPDLLGGIFMIGWEFNVPPGASQVINYQSAGAETATRVHSLFGHRHANTDRFTAWANIDGERVRIYEDYDWAEPAEMVYNTVTDNGTPDPTTLTPGGYSGMLELGVGDSLEWECEVNNRTDQALTFGNEVYTAEMCNLFGAAVNTAAPIWYEFRPTYTLK